DAKLLEDNPASTTVLCAFDSSGAYRHRRDALEAAGARVINVPTDKTGRLSISEILKRLRGLFVSELLVEPGPILAASFFESEMLDRVWVFQSPKPIDAEDAP